MRLKLSDFKEKLQNILLYFLLVFSPLGIQISESKAIYVYNEPGGTKSVHHDCNQENIQRKWLKACGEFMYKRSPSNLSHSKSNAPSHPQQNSYPPQPQQNNYNQKNADLESNYKEILFKEMELKYDKQMRDSKHSRTKSYNYDEDAEFDEVQRGIRSEYAKEIAKKCCRPEGCKHEDLYPYCS